MHVPVALFGVTVSMLGLPTHSWPIAEETWTIRIPHRILHRKEWTKKQTAYVDIGEDLVESTSSYSGSSRQQLPAAEKTRQYQATPLRGDEQPQKGLNTLSLPTDEQSSSTDEPPGQYTWKRDFLDAGPERLDPGSDVAFAQPATVLPSELPPTTANVEAPSDDDSFIPTQPDEVIAEGTKDVQSTPPELISADSAEADDQHVVSDQFAKASKDTTTEDQPDKPAQQTAEEQQHEQENQQRGQRERKKKKQQEQEREQQRLQRQREWDMELELLREHNHE